MERERADRLIREWFARALAAVDPAVAVDRAVGAMPHLVDGPPPVVLAIGKAAGAMTAGLVRSLPQGIARGVLITKDRKTVGQLPASVHVREAGHPIPDDRTIRATEAALAMLGRSSPDEPVVVLLSGGGSALFEAPVDGVTLGEIAALTALMLRAGATINELNGVRSTLSRVKRGGLLGYIRDPRPVTLVLSDVIGNDLCVIASGPTIVAPRGDDPLLVLERLGLTSAIDDRLSALIESHPSSMGVASAPSPVIVADNDTAIDAFAAAAREEVAVEVVWRQRTGEARDLAVEWAATCLSAPSDIAVIVGGGEATVTVRGDGVGGRNTEFAVASALELDRLKMVDWVIASLATDGDDGPTGAAGGIVSRRTVQAARYAGVDPAADLDANDTRLVLEVTGDLVVTGPTGTNVNDLYVAVRVR